MQPWKSISLLRTVKQIFPLVPVGFFLFVLPPWKRQPILNLCFYQFSFAKLKSNWKQFQWNYSFGYAMHNSLFVFMSSMRKKNRMARVQACIWCSYCLSYILFSEIFCVVLCAHQSKKEWQKIEICLWLEKKPINCCTTDVSCV